jgi:hypothetical protein
MEHGRPEGCTMIHTVPRLALGDLRERIRRPSYGITLLCAALLAYLSVPAADGRWTIVDAAGFRGVYDMAYVGAVVALGGALWLALGGFFVVRGSVARDRTTAVGRVLATAPLRSVGYLAGKLLSNIAVLMSMVAVLVVVALVMWWVRGEDPGVDPVALLTPFLVLTVPVVVAVAALALLFDTVPGLRGGLGNLLWLPIWMVIAMGGNNAGALFGGLGTSALAASFGRDIERELAAVDGEFGLGLMQVDEPLTPIPWGGLTLDGGFLTDRLLLVAVAVAVALLPALWFRVQATDAASGREGSSGWAGRLASGIGVRFPVPPTVVLAEFRVLVSGVALWGGAGTAALVLAGLVLPVDTVRSGVLVAAWIWPTLLWSRIGAAQVGVGLEGLLAAYPRPAYRQVAGWAAGGVLALLVGSGALVRLLMAGEVAAVLAWCAAAVFVPAFAAALGTLTRTPTPFQVLYALLWYLALSDVRAADFMGLSEPSALAAAVVAAVGAALLAAALLTARVRRLYP